VVFLFKGLSYERNIKQDTRQIFLANPLPFTKNPFTFVALFLKALLRSDKSKQR
jgi:hypothetical protein